MTDDKDWDDPDTLDSGDEDSTEDEGGADVGYPCAGQFIKGMLLGWLLLLAGREALDILGVSVF